jgi:deoxyribodipyrimidine photolyase-related protein
MSDATAPIDLVLLLGDGLDRRLPAAAGLDPQHTVYVLLEVAAEIRRYPNHRARVLQFLAAMRAMADELRHAGLRVHYQSFDDPSVPDDDSLSGALSRVVQQLGAQSVRWVAAGRHGLDAELVAAVEAAGARAVVVPDPHFIWSPGDFAQWASGRSVYLMEHFYRVSRRRTGLLMDGAAPVGGQWNFDHDNRESFGRSGPELAPPTPMLTWPAWLEDLREAVERLPGLWGTTRNFQWPITPAQAEVLLEHFVEHHLASFGRYQDAVWAGQPWLHHSRLSAAMNLKILDARKVCARVEQAYEQGQVPLNSAEGFIRQIIGWREYIRGIYWLKMPEYEHLNSLGAREPLPELFWTGQTDMVCLADVVGQLRDHAYAHHIQRLMVAGLFALLYGVRPIEIHEWFMACYVDSVEWVTLPNVVGMSQFADGGIVGSKPYIASGKYIQRQTNYCASCRFDPALAVGERACPFTTLYWDFLLTHEERFANHPRLKLQVRNVTSKSAVERAQIRQQAAGVRAKRAESPGAVS